MSDHSLNLLRELQGQMALIEQERRILAMDLAKLDGREDGLRHLETRLRNGMIDGFPRLDPKLSQEESK